MTSVLLASAIASGTCPLIELVDSRGLDETPTFNWRTFFTQLSSARLGRTVLHFDEVSSTQTVLDTHPLFLKSVPADAGLVLVANRQLTGRGRGSNGWISPRGSMSVTVHFRYNPLPPYLIFIQYVAGLAVVEAVRSTPGYEALPLRVKWPNDIYYCPNEPVVLDGSGATTFQGAVKLGGVLVTAQSMGNVVDVMVGVGVNVCNPHPTVSLAQVIEQWAAQFSTPLGALSVEYVLAKFLTHFEALVARLAESGFAGVSDTYYKRWLHTDTLLEAPGVAGLVRVTGVDASSGELTGVSVATGEAIGLSPGSNSFDILKGMVSRKI